MNTPDSSVTGNPGSPEQHRLPRLADRFLARLLDGAGAWLRRQKPERVRRLAEVLGALLWLCLPGRRRLATRAIIDHLHLPEAEARHLARRSFTENAHSFLETALTPIFGLKSPRVRVDPPEVFERIIASERPMMLATAHFGAWELQAGIVGDFPVTYPRAVVVRTSRNAVIDEFTTRMRGSRGTQVIGHRNAAPAVLRIFRKKGIVGFLVDHNATRSEAVFLPFLGETAAVNKGPALLALRAKAMVFAVFLRREGNDYVYHMEEVIDCASVEGESEERIERVALAYTQAVERMVRRAPEQWFWMHKRWKTRP